MLIAPAQSAVLGLHNSKITIGKERGTGTPCSSKHLAELF